MKNREKKRQISEDEVAITADCATLPEKRFKSVKSSRRSRLIFYCVLMIFPLTQFLVFYCAVNFNSILLAFKKYDLYTREYSFVAFENFGKVLSDLKTVEYLGRAFKNSFLLYGVNILTILLATAFSYSVYKGHFLSGLYKVVLFMPSILSDLALVLIYKYFVEVGLPEVGKLFGLKINGLLSQNDKLLPTILFYNVWAGFGVQIIMFSSAMSDIPVSIVEAAQIDGITALKEFFFITVPRTFSIIVVYVVATTAGIFINQMGLFSFYGRVAEYNLYTIGYYFYATIVNPATGIVQYPYLSAFGLLLTVLALPMTWGIKRLLEFLGPKDE